MDGALYKLDDYARCHHCGKTKKWRGMLLRGNYYYCDRTCRNYELAHETA